MTAAILRVLSVVLSLSTMAACSADPCADLDLADPWLELGTGATAFEALVDGQTLTVNYGSQGGVHIFGSFEVGGVQLGSETLSDGLRNQDLPIIEFTIEGDEGVLSNDNRAGRVLERSEDGAGALIGRWVDFRRYASLPEDWEQIDWDELERELEQQELRFSASLLDSCGVQVRDERGIYLDFGGG